MEIHKHYFSKNHGSNVKALETVELGFCKVWNLETETIQYVDVADYLAADKGVDEHANLDNDVRKPQLVSRTTLTTDEVAAYLGISRGLVYTLVREKRIPSIKIGRRILFKIDSINRWITQQEEAGLINHDAG